MPAVLLAPAEEDVGRALGQALPVHDPAALVVDRRVDARRIGREHRRLGLLDLEEQWVLAVAPCSSTTQQPVPTLPTPTTLRATSTMR